MYEINLNYFDICVITDFILDGSASIHNRSDFNILLKSYSITSLFAYIFGSSWTYPLYISNKTWLFHLVLRVSWMTILKVYTVFFVFRLFAGLLILIVGGLFQIVFQSPIFELILSLGGAFLFCLFIIVDTQMIMKTLSAEEYILATINLYMDIVNLFLYILRILQELNRQ